MRNLVFSFLFILTAINITSCGEVEQDPKPIVPSIDIEIPENYYENSDLFYKPTRDQVEELLNLNYPANWYDEENLELHAKYYYAMLLQKYGDRPEVHIEAQFYRIQLLADGKPITISSHDSMLGDIARYLLWPNASNLSVLQRVKTIAEETDILMNTDDPDVYVEILTKWYIRQYGDIPEVHTVVEGEKKMKFEGFRVHTEVEKDDYINYHRALYKLQPTERHLCTLNAYIEAKKNGTPFHLVELDCPM